MGKQKETANHRRVQSKRTNCRRGITNTSKRKKIMNLNVIQNTMKVRTRILAQYTKIQIYINVYIRHTN